MTSAATVTISSINNAGVDEVYAIGLVAEDGTAYPASASGGSYSVSVPQGKYTAIYLAKGNDAAQVLMHSNFAAMEVCSTIHTNVQTSALSVSILSFIATVKGSVVLLQPVDFAKTGLRPAAGSG